MAAPNQVIGPGEDQVRAISDLLRKVTQEGGDGNALSLSTAQHYVQFAAERGVRRIRCEAVSNNFLTPPRKLTNDQIGRLRSLGWNEPSSNRSANYWLDYDIATDAARLALTRLVIQTLEVYGWSTHQEISTDLILEDRYRGDR
jgi:hypothetical protein